MMNDDSLSLLIERRSIRRYRPDPIPWAMIERIIVAATWAPSAHNRQPWRFTLVDSRSLKQRLAEAMGERLRSDLIADGVPQELAERDVARSYGRISRAPVLVLVCLTMSDMDSYADERRQQNERIMAIQSTAMAGQNLLLAAHAQGLGACWLCAPLFCPETVAEALDLPADWQPQGLVTIGYPAESRHKQRAPLPERMNRRS